MCRGWRWGEAGYGPCLQDAVAPWHRENKRAP